MGKGTETQGGGGGGGTLYNGLYRKAPPKRDVFFEDLGIWKGKDFTS